MRGIMLNGDKRDIGPGTTVADVVAEICATSRGVAVARNGEIVPRSEWSSTTLASDDEVEIVTAVAGG